MVRARILWKESDNGYVEVLFASPLKVDDEFLLSINAEKVIFKVEHVLHSPVNSETGNEPMILYYASKQSGPGQLKFWTDVLGSAIKRLIP